MKSQRMHTRIDPTLKQEAEQIFSALGINTAEAIRMFFAQVTLHRGLPFDLRVPNRATQKAISESRAKTNLTPLSLTEIRTRHDA